ncbi:MAG: hypothetical protein ABI634_19130 [Acidobacteriota bacterium]
MTDALLAELFHALNLVALERLPNHMFHLLTPEPRWLSGAFEAAPAGERNMLAGAFPFLDDFLRQASGAWQAGPHASLVSGPFAATVDEDDLLIRASALTVNGRAILVLERLVGAADTGPVLRKARQHMLESELLAREASKIHAPAEAISEAVKQLQSSSIAEDQQPAITRLADAIAALTHIAAGLPGRKTR